MSEPLDPAADAPRPMPTTHPAVDGIPPAAVAPAAARAPTQVADGLHASSSMGARLRWFLAEFVVVVAGVLVALALSGVMEEHRDQQRAQVYLRQLSADLGRSEQELAQAVTSMRERAQAAARVLHRFWRQAPALDEALMRDLAQPRSTRRYRPVLGTAEALGSSGELGLIRSDALRADLLAYVELVRTRLDEITRYDETYYRPGVAMLSLAPALTPPSNSGTPLRDDSVLSRPNQYDRVPFPATPAELLDSHEVYTGYNFLLTAHRNHAEQYQEMLQATRTLKEQVDAAITR